jgi:anti-sigma-K factor RskA
VTEHEDPHLLSGAYALDAVTPEEAAAVERAMATSEDLRSEVAELTDTAVLLGLAVPPAEPSPGLRARLLAAVESTPQLPAATEEERAEEERPEPIASAPAPAVATGPASREAQRRWFTRPGALLAAVAAAAALLFGAGVLVDNLVRPSSSSTQAVSWSELTSASDVQHRTARTTGGATVSVYWSAKLGASGVVVQGAEAPAGKSMQLWRMEGGKATSAGLWHPPAGADHQVIRGGMHKGQTFGITIEPAGGSPQPTSTPVVAIPIT